MSNTYSCSFLSVLTAAGALWASSAEAAPRYRPNQASMSSAEQAAFVNALHSMKNTYEVGSSFSVYDQFVHTHLVTMDGHHGHHRPQAHGGPGFLPWHRQYIWEFETLLLQHDTTGLLTGLPYWDWTVDQNPNGGPWTENFLGGSGDPNDDFIVKTGPFSAGEGWFMFDDPDYPLFRNFGDPADLPTAQDVANALMIGQYDTSPWDMDADISESFRNHLEGWRLDDDRGLHNLVHIWVGGMMETMASPFDPVFWLHHSFVDRIWVEWQLIWGFDSYLPLGVGPEGHRLSDELIDFGVIISDTLNPVDYAGIGYYYEGLAIPEPSTYALVFGAVALVWAFKRRRKKEAAA